MTQVLLQSKILPQHILNVLNQNLPAFYFGNVCPDVQSITNISRYETHFFKVHEPNQKPAENKLLKKYPELNSFGNHHPINKAFIAGYCCHLQADQEWVDLIFGPIFGRSAKWETLNRRLYIHNVFRTYHDLKIFNSICNVGNQMLKNFPGGNLLPFIEDSTLDEWRLFLVDQLKPDHECRTAKIFAERQGLDPNHFLELLASKDRMNSEVFSKVPEYIIEKYKQTVFEKNTKFLIEYLSEI